MKRALVKAINEHLLRGRDARVVRASTLYPWQLQKDATVAVAASASLAPDAEAYLTPENPRLIELQERYGRCDPAAINPLQWGDDTITRDDLKSFRGDNAYV